MRLLHLTLEQFRNHQSLQLNFELDQPITYLVGANAQGKTNILEAIYLLALTKSFRAPKQHHLIGWDFEYARIKGLLEIDEQKTELEVFLGSPPQPLKALKKNGVKTTAANFIGTCQVVFFHPEDLDMLYLGPDLRRRYLDIMNVQINKNYYRALQTYRRVLEQRNALLKNIKRGLASQQDLAIWDQQLVESGSIIIEQRATTIAFFNKHLQNYYHKISQKNEQIKVEYLHNTQPDYAQALATTLSKDLQAEYTTVGPHRDDFLCLMDERPLGSHASRGEYRSLLLALKLLELQFFEEKSKEKPLLLLDDVFSELDFKRQEMLLKAIDQHQTIITTTHLDELIMDRTHKNSSLKNGKYVQVEQGAIFEAINS